MYSIMVTLIRHNIIQLLIPRAGRCYNCTGTPARNRFSSSISLLFLLSTAHFVWFPVQILCGYMDQVNSDLLKVPSAVAAADDNPESSDPICSVVKVETWKVRFMLREY